MAKNKSIKKYTHEELKQALKTIVNSSNFVKAFQQKALEQVDPIITQSPILPLGGPPVPEEYKEAEPPIKREVARLLRMDKLGGTQYGQKRSIETLGINPSNNWSTKTWEEASPVEEVY